MREDHATLTVVGGKTAQSDRRSVQTLLYLECCGSAGVWIGRCGLELMHRDVNESHFRREFDFFSLFL